MKLRVCFVFLIIANKIFRSHQELECTGKTKLRKFTLTAEFYSTMGSACGDCPDTLSDCNAVECVTGDGREGTIIAVNKQMPGPIIEVCEGDTVVVKVNNNLKGISTTVNFHGQEQLGTPFEDGVPFITQCPIHEGNFWTYRFVANNIGTHIYESHSGLQLTNGFLGPLIVRTKRDPNRKFYDFDKHVLVLQDYFSDMAEEHFPGNTDLAKRGQIPHNVLINGRGFFLVRPGTGELTGVPLTVVTVTENKKYRIRILNAGSMECPLKFQIQDHQMSVIATDGLPLKPLDDVDTVILLPGERFDVVVEADQTPGAYIIQVTAMGACAQFGITQQALLCYSGETCTNPPNVFDILNLPETKVVNPVGEECDPGNGRICAYQLEALEECRKCGRGDKHAKKFTLKFNLHDYGPEDIFGASNRKNHAPYFIPAEGDDDTFFMRAGQINKISNIIPPFPLLSNPGKLGHLLKKNPDYKCNRDRSNHQICLHMIHVDKGDTIDIILEHDVRNAIMYNAEALKQNINLCDILLKTNQEDKSFSMQLHGYKFCVLYQGHSMTEALDSRINAKTVMKDTIVIPGSGITRIRFVGNNPGFWLLHSQNIFYDITGMSLILSIGEESDLPSIPFQFPKCGNYENYCESGSCDDSTNEDSSNSS